jgi:predicted DNA-binding transcriptional regulator YafY
MRSQRMIACILLLQGKHRLTARELAASLEVSMRTVYRDVEALCEAGVPIHMERGPQGGIVLADDYRRALAQFTNDELQSLFAVAASPLSDLGIMAHPQALQKLAGALPASQRRAAESSRDRLLLDHNRWSRGDQPTSVLVRLRAAIAGDCSVRLRYRDRGGATTERTVDPLGLVAKAGIWYLVATEAEKGYRTFRAQRILDVEQSGARFARPPDFNLEAYWNSSVAIIESRPADATYDVVMRVSLEAMGEHSSYWETTIISEEPDAITMRVRYPSREFAAMQTLFFGEGVEVLEPPDLKSAIADYARVALARYGT